jgi:hypothetical protein
MCSAADDPTTYDAPSLEDVRPSVALAVLGELLNAYEYATPTPCNKARLEILRQARDRVAAAEAQL